MILWVANRFNLRTLTLALALTQPVCINMMSVPELKRLTLFLKSLLKHSVDAYHVSFSSKRKEVKVIAKQK